MRAAESPGDDAPITERVPRVGSGRSINGDAETAEWNELIDMLSRSSGRRVAPSGCSMISSSSSSLFKSSLRISPSLPTALGIADRVGARRTSSTSSMFSFERSL